MELPRNAIKRAMQEKRPHYGLFSTLASPYAAEIVAGCGFDWILVDLEHAPNDVPTLLEQLQAIAPYRSQVAVRLPSNDEVVVKRVLDVGVQTLLVPHVSNAQEARAAVASTRYPPAGVRGVGGTTRATRFGRVKDYVTRAHEEICLFPMVENQEGLDNIEAICAVEGVDGVFLGPGDLSVELGYQGKSNHPELLSRIEDATRRIARTGKASGYMSTVEADVRRMVRAGALFCGVGMDAAILARTSEALSSAFR